MLGFFDSIAPLRPQVTVLPGGGGEDPWGAAIGATSSRPPPPRRRPGPRRHRLVTLPRRFPRKFSEFIF